jgi:hypothetical protein
MPRYTFPVSRNRDVTTMTHYVNDSFCRMVYHEHGTTRPALFDM